MTRSNKSKVLISEIIKRKKQLSLSSSDEESSEISLTIMLNKEEIELLSSTKKFRYMKHIEEHHLRLISLEKNKRDRSQKFDLEIRSRKSSSEYFMNSQIVIVRKKRYKKYVIYNAAL